MDSAILLQLEQHSLSGHVETSTPHRKVGLVYIMGNSEM